ncbi:MAG: phosphoribosylformylglycinamidine synthase subunit PurS [Bacteroidota bacterium]|jgi:phosphoribosylformylglycinamidine synthase
MYKATVRVTLRNSILDPQGKASRQALNNLGLQEVNEVRIGKLIELEVDANDEEQARKITETACKQLLANPVMEDYEIELSEA